MSADAAMLFGVAVETSEYRPSVKAVDRRSDLAGEPDQKMVEARASPAFEDWRQDVSRSKTPHSTVTLQTTSQDVRTREDRL
jgi:hypothetical protein